ncbi:hypothetical protein B0A78_09065 [Flavobacterium columnare NBRC 100251 = ATCC 23463]|uniref:hypothetical protein n=1 Tax=Flavobacterium columnare TaxID=996 RepID=UPI0007F9D317|nr:hypothetical protein [Flavobacterium columnare]ANO48509.1 McrBC 5-methylcytosine restriction system component-like protein [Flavobacterium columnare]APT23436.1 hypothetical protein BU993_12860 [Flavobacterium columnare]PDS23504.1 hypothetical protein B0A78_09065 [Flavobacterium columnare NBRC 100251 = ATCC 23463]GEM58589.1 hypothetical protein FC1_18270 [Flavobacterium columnare NBRC 100251 = ATCC 23463]
MIIDTKYKLRYKEVYFHQDIRQVVGYARLNRVREKLKIQDDTNIDCLIISLDIQEGIEDFSLETIFKKEQRYRLIKKFTNYK